MKRGTLGAGLGAAKGAELQRGNPMKSTRGQLGAGFIRHRLHTHARTYEDNEKGLPLRAPSAPNSIVLLWSDENDGTDWN